jgi:hypothetical protein
MTSPCVYKYKRGALRDIHHTCNEIDINGILVARLLHIHLRKQSEQHVHVLRLGAGSILHVLPLVEEAPIRLSGSVEKL